MNWCFSYTLKPRLKQKSSVTVALSLVLRIPIEILILGTIGLLTIRSIDGWKAEKTDKY